MANKIKIQSRLKCKFCDSYHRDVDAYITHLESDHEDMIPNDMSPKQFYYYLKTGKKEGKCIVDKRPTSFNEKTCKYNRFCNNPKCKEQYREMFKKRMIGKYGKITLLNDPEQQKIMLSNRKISGKYTWSNREGEVGYTGSYELDFLKFLDNVMNYNYTDIMAPSPHVYYYIYDNKRHFYFPDVYIPSLNLEIEIKDGGDNPNTHHKIVDVDKVKEKLKDEVVVSSKSFHYIKIVNKEYKRFFQFLERLKYNTEIGKENELISIY